jgi:hypothetical protein
VKRKDDCAQRNDGMIMYSEIIGWLFVIKRESDCVQVQCNDGMITRSEMMGDRMITCSKMIGWLRVVKW